MVEPIHVDDITDIRVAPFVQLKSRRNVASVHFVAEGRWVTRRLLESSLDVTAVLVIRGEETVWADAIATTRMSKTMPMLFVADKATLRAVVGYDFHRGVLACGVRPKLPRLDALPMPTKGSESVDLFLDGISDAENVGNILRTAAGLGVGRVLLGPTTLDPFRRRIIRVSMASVFGQSLYQTDDAAEALQTMAAQGYRIVASSLDDDADDLMTYKADDRPTILVVGNEAEGLATTVQNAATDRVRIAMSDGVDSLNVASATSILLWRLRSS